MPFREILTASRRTLIAVAFALAGFAAAPAHAEPVSVGSTITVSYDRPFLILPDLTATLSLTVESMTSNQIVLGVDAANTTSSWFLTSRLSSISFGTGIAPTAASDTSTAYNVTLTRAGQIGLTGNRSTSLRPTQSELFTLTLVGNFGSTIDLSNFTAKFQSLIGTYSTQGTITNVTGGSGAGAGGSTGTSGGAGGGNSVPEPSTLSLLAVGLFSLLTYRLLRQRGAPQPVRIKVRK